MTPEPQNLPGIPESEEQLAERAARQPLDVKVRRAVALLRSYRDKAISYSPRGYYLAFSGGKDSCVCKALCQEAGVPFRAVYNNTTIDPPELTAFLREAHPDVEWSGPPKGEGFFSHLRRRGLPRQHVRWCCHYLKEGGGKKEMKIIGVRAEESARRAALWRELTLDRNGGAPFLAPIVHWTDEDVWAFIRSRGIPYCKLYDEGFARIGCIGCCMKGGAAVLRDFKRWPRHAAAYEAAARIYFAAAIERRKAQGKRIDDTFEDYWRIWLDLPPLKAACAQDDLFAQAGGADLDTATES